MAENSQPDAPQPPAQAPCQSQPGGCGQGNELNERTYQEVEYLKRNLGPILVAALAEICIRRPADPIEYLGHWLLRWRYNEELKRRDVQNALEVVRRKTWETPKEEIPQPIMTNPAAPEAAPTPEVFTQGFIPQHPYAPTGYGGPLTTEQVQSVAEPPPPPPPPVEPAPVEVIVVTVPVPVEAEAAPPPPVLETEVIELVADPDGSGQQVVVVAEKRISLGPDGQPKRVSATPADPQPRRASEGQGQKRASQSEGERRGSGAGERRASGEKRNSGAGERRGSLE